MIMHVYIHLWRLIHTYSQTWPSTCNGLYSRIRKLEMSSMWQSQEYCDVWVQISSSKVYKTCIIELDVMTSRKSDSMGSYSTTTFSLFYNEIFVDILYIHMCTLYTYTNICMPRFSPSGFFGPSRYLFLTPGLTSKYPICVVCVCVCVYTHIHPHTIPPALKTDKTTDNTPIFPSFKNNPPRQATSALID